MPSLRKNVKVTNEKARISYSFWYLSFLGRVHCTWKLHCFSNSTRQCSTCQNGTCSLHWLLSYDYKLSIQHKKVRFWSQLFQSLVNVALRLHLMWSFQEKFLQLLVQHDKVQNRVSSRELSIQYPHFWNSIWFESGKNWNVIICNCFLSTNRLISDNFIEYNTNYNEQLYNFIKFTFHRDIFWNISSRFFL